MGKGKIQFMLIFYLNKNAEVQLDLKNFEIFIFSQLLPSSLSAGKMREE